MNSIEIVAGGPFGDGYSASGEDIDAYHFAGQDQDSSASDHGQFREYSNMTGRWQSPDPYSGSYDPLNPQSMNRYAYVLGNPLTFTDALGLYLVCYETPDTGWDGDGNTVGVTAGSSVCNSVGYGPVGGGYGPNYGQIGGGGGGAGAGTSSAPGKSVLNCASAAASKVSIAGGLQALGIGSSAVGGFVANALGGNTFSGITDLVSSIATGSAGGHSVFYNMGQSLLAGPTQGFGAVFGKSIAGTPFASGPVDAVMAAGLGKYATGVGEVKLIYDGATYFGATAGCALGIIH